MADCNEGDGNQGANASASEALLPHLEALVDSLDVNPRPPGNLPRTAGATPPDVLKKPLIPSERIIPKTTAFRQLLEWFGIIKKKPCESKSKRGMSDLSSSDEWVNVEHPAFTERLSDLRCELKADESNTPLKDIDVRIDELNDRLDQLLELEENYPDDMKLNHPNLMMSLIDGFQRKIERLIDKKIFLLANPPTAVEDGKLDGCDPLTAELESYINDVYRNEDDIDVDVIGGRITGIADRIQKLEAFLVLHPEDAGTHVPKEHSIPAIIEAYYEKMDRLFAIQSVSAPARGCQEEREWALSYNDILHRFYPAAFKSVATVSQDRVDEMIKMLERTVNGLLLIQRHETKVTPAYGKIGSDVWSLIDRINENIDDLCRRSPTLSPKQVQKLISPQQATRDPEQARMIAFNNSLRQFHCDAYGFGDMLGQQDINARIEKLQERKRMLIELGSSGDMSSSDLRRAKHYAKIGYDLKSLIEAIVAKCRTLCEREGAAGPP